MSPFWGGLQGTGVTPTPAPASPTPSLEAPFTGFLGDPGDLGALTWLWWRFPWVLTARGTPAAAGESSHRRDPKLGCVLGPWGCRAAVFSRDGSTSPARAG